MKQFLLFAGSDYYPCGGWDDFEGDFDSVLEAVTAVAKVTSYEHDWFQVVDSKTGEEVYL